MYSDSIPDDEFFIRSFAIVFIIYMHFINPIRALNKEVIHPTENGFIYLKKILKWSPTECSIDVSVFNFKITYAIIVYMSYDMY